MRTVSHCAVAILMLAVAASAQATPTVPQSAHPRLFMSSAQIAGYTANAAKSKTAAAQQVAQCQDTIDDPTQYKTRGTSDGNYWPNSAVACAFAWRATGMQKYLTQALIYWQASLSDDQTIGDKAGCVPNVNTHWQTWAKNMSGATPPVILTVTHDDDYPMRWYGPDIALTYDWLYSAPGVTPALLQQTQTCLTNWLDFYTAYGYHHDQADANYNAGFIIGKALGAIAIGSDGGADGHLWTEVVNDQFGTLLVGQGLTGAGTPVGQPVGPMVGGDWLEGWQYGELSVLEYAVAARALESFGAPEPAMDAWTNSLFTRYLYGNTPALDGQWVGGDFDDTSDVYQAPSREILDAVLAGPSSDQAAAWANSLAATQAVGAGAYVYDALAELRTTPAADYRTQSPAPATWYLSRGSRALYGRSSWAPTAFWGVFSSAPAAVSDHEHFSASNFVFSRGSDHLIVDPSEYGAMVTFETNAVSADSPQFTGNYQSTQGGWSEAELVWARGTSDAVLAARSDFHNAFEFDGNPTDIPYAHREWVMLPEGEVVTIDRVQTADATHYMYVNFHANTAGTLTLNGSTATGTVGGSKVAIHAVKLSGGTPAIGQPAAISGDYSKCPGAYPFGTCTDARFAVDIYQLKVPGPYASAVHVIDGLGADSATVDSMNDGTIDPGAAQNGGVIGAAVLRTAKQSYVVAASANDGASSATMTYGVPGGSAARHIVFDAPEASDGSSTVMAAASGGRCVVTITAGTGGGFTGHPLMFTIDTAANACAAANGTNAPSAMPPTTGGVDAGANQQADGGLSNPNPPDSGTPVGDNDMSVVGNGDMSTARGHSNAGGCSVGGVPTTTPLALLLICALLLIRRRQRISRSVGMAARNNS